MTRLAIGYVVLVPLWAAVWIQPAPSYSGWPEPLSRQPQAPAVVDFWDALWPNNGPWIEWTDANLGIVARRYPWFVWKQWGWPSMDADPYEDRSPLDEAIALRPWTVTTVDPTVAERPRRFFRRPAFEVEEPLVVTWLQGRTYLDSN